MITERCKNLLHFVRRSEKNWPAGFVQAGGQSIVYQYYSIAEHSTHYIVHILYYYLYTTQHTAANGSEHFPLSDTMPQEMWSLDESTVCLLASFVNVQAKDQIYLKLLKAISISSSLAALLLLHFFLCVYNHCLDMRLLIVQYEKSRMAKKRKRLS